MPIPSVSAKPVCAVKPANTLASHLKAAVPKPPAITARGSRDAFASRAAAPAPVKSQNKPNPSVLEVKSGGGGRSGAVIGNAR